MKKNCLCVGVHFANNYNITHVFQFIDQLTPIKDYVKDFQFAFHDPDVCKSGRMPTYVPKNFILLFIRLMAVNGYGTTVLMNQAEESKFDLIIRELKDYVDAGLTGVCTQKIELAKMIKKAYPHLELQSSCLSYKTKFEEFEEELAAGFSIINPINDIVRDPENLKRNHEKGMLQKILVAEGCFNKCPFEKIHREAVSTGKGIDENKLCTGLLKDPENFPLFLKANWITIQRMVELEEYIDVIKLARGTLNKGPGNNISDISRGLVRFVERYLATQKGDYINYNILDYTATAGNSFLNKLLPNGIPSQIIDKYDMFNHIDDQELLIKIRNEIFDFNGILY